MSLDAVKLQAAVPFPPDEVHAVTRQVELRKSVNPNIRKIELLEQHEFADVLYQVITPPIPFVSARALLVQRQFSTFKSQNCNGDEVTGYKWYMKSIDSHPLAPNDGDAIRATVHLQAIRIEPHPKLPKHSVVTVINQFDVGGWIPSAAIAIASSKMTSEVVDKMGAHVAEYRRRKAQMK